MQYTSNVLSPSLEQLFSCSTIAKTSNGWELTGLPQVSRPIYERFKKILVALGGFWDGETHRFFYDPTASIQEMLQVKKIPKVNPYSLFETPQESVSDLLDLINMHFCSDDFTKEWRILEPSAGRGAIARQIRDRLPHAQIDCLEIDPINQEILASQGFNVIGEDFLTAKLKGKYQFIVMNPPFERCEYIKHITKACFLLKRNGILGAIAPQSMMTGATKAEVAFRNLVAEQGTCESIGSPFEFTKVKCLQLKIEPMTSAQRQKAWSTTNGYPSWFAYNLILHLDNERKWHDFHSQNVRDRKKIGELADDIVNQYLREGTLLYYDDPLREFAIDKFIDDLPEPIVLDELEIHFAKLAAKAKPIKKQGKHVQLPFFDQDYLNGIEQLELTV